MKHPTNTQVETHWHQLEMGHAMTQPQQSELRPINDEPRDPRPTPRPKPPGPSGGGSTSGEPKPGDTLGAAIKKKWRELGGESWGRPDEESGEMSIGDGRGRWAQFFARDGSLLQIVWMSKTGAHEVLPPMSECWARVGHARGVLGYPTGGEQAWPEGQANSLQQSFQSGRILMRGSDACTVEDPVAFTKGLRGRGGFGGKVNMHLHSDGRVQFFGEVTNGSYQDYDYSIYALVRSPNLNLAMRKSGQINMQVFGRNKNRWSEDATHTLVNASFADLSAATFEVHDNHEGGITGKIDDVLSTLASWTITRALGPAVVGVIYAGIELGAIVTGGSFQAGPRIIAGTLWMLGPEGYLVGMAVDSLARIGTRSRGLHADEKKFLRLVFGDSINLDRITLTDTAGKNKRAFTFPSPMPDTHMNLNLGNQYEPLPKLGDKAYVTLLAHEAMHAWQYKHMANHSSYVLRGIFDSEYKPGTLGKPWHKYNIEQQATIVEEWAVEHYTPGVVTNDYGLSSADALDDQRFPYIAGHIRVGRNRESPKQKDVSNWQPCEPFLRCGDVQEKMRGGRFTGSLCIKGRPPPATRGGYEGGETKLTGCFLEGADYGTAHTPRRARTVLPRPSGTPSRHGPSCLALSGHR